MSLFKSNRRLKIIILSDKTPEGVDKRIKTDLFCFLIISDIRQYFRKPDKDIQPISLITERPLKYFKKIRNVFLFTKQ